jgi:hypothetical protein
MSNTLLLLVAVAVFSLMLIGIVLTVLEFSRGEPARQEEEEKLRRRVSGRSPGSGR